MQYRRHGDTNYNLKFVPFTVETLGRLGQPAMGMLRQLGDMVLALGHAGFCLCPDSLWLNSTVSQAGCADRLR
jgi:hypothetical protein